MIDAQRVLAQLQVAMMLLSRLPAGNLTSPIPKLTDAIWAFPVVGLFVGGIGAGTLALALWLSISPGLAAGMALIATVLATGGLHEDGLADVADGFGGGQTRARKLEIMRDSRIGSYGTLALILSVGMRWQALMLVSVIYPSLAVWLMISVAMISRAGLPAIMVALPPAREDGLGRSASGGDWAGAAIAAAIGAVAVMIALGPLNGIVVMLAIGVTLAAMAALAMRQIGGQTGDVLGAAQQMAELTAWVVISAVLGS